MLILSGFNFGNIMFQLKKKRILHNILMLQLLFFSHSGEILINIVDCGSNREYLNWLNSINILKEAK